MLRFVPVLLAVLLAARPAAAAPVAALGDFGLSSVPSGYRMSSAVAPKGSAEQLTLMPIGPLSPDRPGTWFYAKHDRHALTPAERALYASHGLTGDVMQCETIPVANWLPPGAEVLGVRCLAKPRPIARLHGFFNELTYIVVFPRHRSTWFVTGNVSAFAPRRLPLEDIFDRATFKSLVRATYEHVKTVDAPAIAPSVKKTAMPTVSF